MIIQPSQGEDVFSGFLPDVPEPSLPVLACPSVSLIHLPPSPTCMRGSSGLNYRDILSRWLLVKCLKGTSQAHPDCNKTALLHYFTFLAYSERSIHIPLPQSSSSPVFQSCSSSVLDDPDKLLATAHLSVHDHMSGHFSF